MENISELQNRIKSSLADCCSSLGFDVDHCPTFYHHEKNAVRIITIVFLDKRHAAYFNSNTASFSLNLGVFFNIDNCREVNLYPKEYEAHIRGKLLRDFKQKHPKDLRGFPVLDPERRRRDIWWVEKDGKNIDGLISHATRLIASKALKWLKHYSDVGRAINLLKKKKGKNAWKGGPFGLGSPGSPRRQGILHRLERIKSIELRPDLLPRIDPAKLHQAMEIGGRLSRFAQTWRTLSAEKELEASRLVSEYNLATGKNYSPADFDDDLRNDERAERDLLPKPRKLDDMTDEELIELIRRIREFEGTRTEIEYFKRTIALYLPCLEKEQLIYAHPGKHAKEILDLAMKGKG